MSSDRRSRPAAALPALLLVLLSGVVVLAHSGPPFPIVSARKVGPYDISLWTDPDATDDGTRAGRFWIVLARAEGGEVPAGTHARIAIRALDRHGDAHEGQADPVDGLVGRQFVAVLMDHEGPFGVIVAVDGPLGHAETQASVDATYDLRPSRIELLVFMIPFLAVGGLWVTVLRRRRQARLRGRASRNSGSNA